MPSGSINHVGLFIDGVFMSNRSGLNVNMFDLERVEVVKGPQSALYGRNTFAGAINYITKKPSDEFEGKIDATLGQYNDQRIMASLSGPIIEDELFFRVAAGYDHNNGTYKNGALKGGLGGHEFKTASLALRWTPNEDFEANLKGYYTDDLVDSAPVSSVPNNEGALQTGAPLAFYYVGEVPGFGSRDLPGLSEESFAQDRTLRRTDLSVDYELEDFTLTSITAYAKLVNTGFEDFDRTQGGPAWWTGPAVWLYDGSSFVSAVHSQPAIRSIRPDVYPTVPDGAGQHGDPAGSADVCQFRQRSYGILVTRTAAHI